MGTCLIRSRNTGTTLLDDRCSVDWLAASDELVLRPRLLPCCCCHDDKEIDSPVSVFALRPHRALKNSSMPCTATKQEGRLQLAKANRGQLPLNLLTGAVNLTSTDVQLVPLQRVDDGFSRLILCCKSGSAPS